MKYMKTQIHSVHFDADKKLLTLIEKKCKYLTRFFNGIIGIDVFLSISKDASLNKVVEIKLDVARNILIAKEQERTFEEALHTCINVLARQLVKHKEKLRSRK